MKKKGIQTIISLCLVVAMLFDFPVVSYSFAAETMQETTMPTIISFAALSDDIAQQVVSIGTPKEELKLPEQLSVEVTTGAGLSVEATTGAGIAATTTVTGVTWESDNYPPEPGDTAKFHPIIPPEYTVGPGVQAPEISVEVKEESGEAVPLGNETEYYIKNGSLEITAVGSYIINGAGTSKDNPTHNTIKIASGFGTSANPVTITLKNVYMKSSGENSLPPIDVKENAYVKMIIEGENQLRNQRPNMPAISLRGGSSIELEGKTSKREENILELTAEGDTAALGAGRKEGNESYGKIKDIKIDGCKVTANASVGIGTSLNPTGDIGINHEITIANSVVTTISGNVAIGGKGQVQGAQVVIENSTVYVPKDAKIGVDGSRTNYNKAIIFDGTIGTLQPGGAGVDPVEISEKLTVPAGSCLNITDGKTLTITGADNNNKAIVENNGSILIANGTLQCMSYAELKNNNNGTISVSDIAGSLKCKSWANLENDGQITIEKGKWEIESEATVNNKFEKQIMIQQGGTVECAGTFKNEGSINVIYGTFENEGSINVSDGGILNLNSEGTLNNAGIIRSSNPSTEITGTGTIWITKFDKGTWIFPSNLTYGMTYNENDVTGTGYSEVYVGTAWTPSRKLFCGASEIANGTQISGTENMKFKIIYNTGSNNIKFSASLASSENGISISDDGREFIYTTDTTVEKANIPLITTWSQASYTYGDQIAVRVDINGNPTRSFEGTLGQLQLLLVKNDRTEIELARQDVNSWENPYSLTYDTRGRAIEIGNFKLRVKYTSTGITEGAVSTVFSTRLEPKSIDSLNFELKNGDSSEQPYSSDIIGGVLVRNYAVKYNGKAYRFCLKDGNENLSNKQNDPGQAPDFEVEFLVKEGDDWVNQIETANGGEYDGQQVKKNGFAGTAEIEMKGKNFYKGSKKIRMQMQSAPLTATGGTINEKSYDGTTMASFKTSPTVTGWKGDDTANNYSIEYNATFADAEVGEKSVEVLSARVCTVNEKNPYNYTLTYQGNLIGKIIKAEAPIAQDRTQTVYTNAEDIYTFTLNNLWPTTLQPHQTLGTVSYDYEVTESPVAPIFNGDVTLKGQTLLIPIKDLGGEWKTEASGNYITVTIHSTHYEDMTAKIGFAESRQLVPSGIVTLKRDLVYGEKLGDELLQGTMYALGEKVEGEFHWENASEEKAAGTHQEGWEFKPNDSIKYITVKGSIPVKVNQAMPRGSVQITNSLGSESVIGDIHAVYEFQNAITKETVDGSLVWLDINGTELDATTKIEKNRTYLWKFIPTDTLNYQPVVGYCVLYRAKEGISYLFNVADQITVKYTGEQKDQIEAIAELPIVTTKEGTIQAELSKSLLERAIERVGKENAFDFTLKVKEGAEKEIAVVLSKEVQNQIAESKIKQVQFLLPNAQYAISADAMQSIAKTAAGDLQITIKSSKKQANTDSRSTYQFQLEDHTTTGVHALQLPKAIQLQLPYQLQKKESAKRVYVAVAPAQQKVKMAKFSYDEKEGKVTIPVKEGGLYAVAYRPSLSKVLGQVSVPKTKTITNKKSSTLALQLPVTLKKVSKYQKADTTGYIVEGKVSYQVAKKEILKINTAGKITANKKGSTVVKTTVTLKDGTKKTYQTKVTVK